MRKKRNILSLIALLLTLSLLVSCGEVVNPNAQLPGTTPEGPTSPEGPDNPDNPENPDGPEGPTSPEGFDFSVGFVYNGSPYIPDETITVEWTNGQTVHRAKVGEDGVARISGLDGEYHVQLVEPFSEYTYNPVGCDVNNDRRDLTIELFKLNTLSSKQNGSNLYEKAYTISKTGYYRAKVTKQGQKLCFRFAAQSSGEYVFTSLMDTGANNVNPILYYYGNASIGYVNEKDVQIITGGGSGFTSNFNFTAYVDNDNLDGSGGGMLVAFAIAADIKSGEYPAYVDFKLEYKRDYEAGSIENIIVVPEELDKITAYAPGHNYDSSKYNLVNAYYTDATTGQNIFEDDRFVYNTATGFYHLFDAEKYAATGGFGPILYAHITSNTIFTNTDFTHIEDAGNKCLSVYIDGKLYNHKLFIQGIGPLLIDPVGDNGPYFCSMSCPCRTSGKCQGACAEGCSTCLDSCRQCPEEGLDCGGYAGVANGDGLCPVTAELQRFLQYFAISQSYFIDGGGWAEIQSDPPYHAGEDDQWLFACCYYEEKPSSN
ncbi:MAG: hypothetical protein IKA64_02610 [Clostridia bacterium]|nr:hypothetical protein [Clostridia bacterium]